MLKQFENRSGGRSPAGPYQAQPLQVCYRIASLPAHAASQHWLHCTRMRMPRGPRMGAELASPHRPRMPHRPPALASARLIGKLGSPRARTPRRPCAGPAAPLPARAPLATDRLLRRDPVTGLTAPQLQVSIPTRTLSAGDAAGGRLPARRAAACTHSPPFPPVAGFSAPAVHRRACSVLDPEPRRLPQARAIPHPLPIPQPFLIPVCG
jgi:hypothetical protein